MSEPKKELDGSFVFAKELVGAIVELVGADAARDFLKKNFPQKDFAVGEKGEVFMPENLERADFLIFFRKNREFLKNMLGEGLAKNVFKNIFLALSQKNVSPESMHLILELVPPGVLEGMGAEFK